MSDDPKKFNSPETKFLSTDDIDSVGRAVIALAMELAVTNDRLISFEDYVSRHGGSDGKVVPEDHLPSEAARKRMAEDRERIVGVLVEALASRKEEN